MLLDVCHALEVDSVTVGHSLKCAIYAGLGPRATLLMFDNCKLVTGFNTDLHVAMKGSAVSCGSSAHALHALWALDPAAINMGAFCNCLYRSN